MSGEMNDLSLEKLKIAEKLDTLITNLAVLTDSHRNTVVLLQKHDFTLYGDGNGRSGMNVRVDRLEQIEDNRRWHIRTIWAAIVAATLKILHLSFK